MKLTKLTRDDFMYYRHELFLTIVYSLVLGIIYGMWTYKSLEPLWPSFLVVLGFLFAGAIFYYFWVMELKKKSVKEE